MCLKTLLLDSILYNILQLFFFTILKIVVDNKKNWTERKIFCIFIPVTGTFQENLMLVGNIPTQEDHNLSFSVFMCTFNHCPIRHQFLFFFLIQQSVVLNQKTGIREGSEFILSCVAQGSPKMQFRWFQNGFIINTSKSTR